MKKRVIVPTDFSIKSLNLVVEVLENNPEIEFDVVLLYTIQMPSSIQDLLFYSKSKVLNALRTEKFNTSCRMLQNHYSTQLKSINTDLFTGQGTRYFNSYLEAMQIDEVFVPEKYCLKLHYKSAYNPCRLLNKCSIPVKKVTWDEPATDVMVNAEDMSGLFFSMTADK